MTSWNNFNTADDYDEYALIPKDTLVKVCLTIKPGGFDDLEQGWTGGYATHNETTGSVYLQCESTVLEGPYAKRKIWHRIGLYSPKGYTWANMGRTFIKALLNSAKGFHPSDQSDQAQQARYVKGIADLDGIHFVAKVDIDQDHHGDFRNTLKIAIMPDHKDYAAIMGNIKPIATSNPIVNPTTQPFMQPKPEIYPSWMS